MSDAEVLTTAMCAGLLFAGNHETAREYMKEHGLMPKMLSKSRFNRRLHAVAELHYELFHQLGGVLKQMNASTEYLLDSFPVPVCENIRISRCREREAFGIPRLHGNKTLLLLWRAGTSVEYRGWDSRRVCLLARCCS
jgi:hypothetical protein